MCKMLQLGKITSYKTTIKNNVLEHVSLVKDLVDHCLTMKKSHSAAKETHIMKVSIKRIPFHFIQNH